MSSTMVRLEKRSLDLDKIERDSDVESDSGSSNHFSYDYKRDERYVNDYELRQERKSGGCCSQTKASIFLIFVVVGLGLVFGIVDFDSINSWFSSVVNGDDSNSSTDSFSFNQCANDSSPCCNGLNSNCDMKVNEVLFASLHNANNDQAFAPNHDAPLEGALENGYRGLYLDVCKCNSNIIFCHGLCEIGRRDPEEVFNNIGAFLSKNPEDVILLNFEMSIGDPSPEEVWALMKQTTIRSKTFIYSGGEWPTFNELLEMAPKKQVIAFYHSGPDCPLNNNPATVGCHPRLIQFHDYFVETDFDFPNIDAIENTSQSCAEIRGASGKKDFYAINAFVTGSLGPSKMIAKEINSKTFIESHIADCESLTQRLANMVAIDFWQEGDLLRVTQDINKSRAALRKI